MSSSAPTVALVAGTRQRWRFLDSLRGFAVFGILLVNALDITKVGMARMIEGGASVSDPLQEVLDGARRRARRPGLVMVRRLVGLTIIGGLLMFVYPGNILLEYGVVGLLMLPVVLFAPGWVTLGAGLVLTVVAYAIFGGGLPSVPGLLLLGAGAAAFGLPRALETSGRAVAVVFAVAAVLTGPALLWQQTTPGDPRFSTPGAVAGLVMAVLYVSGLALLWRTPARTAIAAAFEPLGRMALSNYVGAAIVMALVPLVVDVGHMTSVAPVVAMSLALIVAQSLLSRLWLTYFVYGPVEWLWRTATWLRPAAFRRAQLTATPVTVP